MVSQELLVLFTKDALCWVYDDSMPLELCKDSTKVVLKLFRCRAGYEQVIQMSIAAGQFAQDLVNESLESLCCIAETEGHA